MTENKTQPTDASVDEFIAAAGPEKQSDSEREVAGNQK